MPAAPRPCTELEAQLAACRALLDDYAHAAFERFGAAGLGLVDLPPLSADAVNPAQVGVAAALLWARELDAAGLPRFVDALVAPGRERGGRVTLPPVADYPFPRAVMERLHAYRAATSVRPDPLTRRAYYERVFGPPFQQRLDALLDALIEHGREPDIVPPSTARVQTAALSLAALLSRRAQGAVHFAVQHIVDAVAEGLAILRDPQVRQAMGGGLPPGPFGLIERHAGRVLGEPVQPTRHLARAEAGAEIVAWLAEHAHALAGGGGLALPRDAAVIRAAERWRSFSEET
ncbi:hypothetical protein [Haliangium sp.]|uniref:hypothetical protein n=1 Tax=Haliangium sp. TaxID=2663208 RepID=UPI003D0C8698